MLVAIVFAALGFQALGPVLPPSCSPSFQATALSIEEALQNHDFAKASDRLRLLPKPSITFSWDDQKVPAAYRSQFRASGDAAMSMWKTRVPGLTFSQKPKGDIRISFEPVLALRAGTNMPAAHVGFWSEDPTAPRLDYVIGLKRGSPLKGSEETDIFNDVAYCVGSYLGISDGVYDTYTMGTTDLSRPVRTAISGTESGTVHRNLQVVRTLQEAVKAKTPLIAAKSDLFIDPLVVDGDPAIQGDRVEFHVQLSNRGNGPLAFSMFPDCGCTVVTDPGVVSPGANRVVSFAVDTTNFTTNTTKHVAVYTNDPTTPVRMVTLNVKIKPRFRLLSPLGDTFVVPNGGLKYAIYLIPANGTSLEPISAKLTGPISAKVSFAPWQGVLPDPELNEGPLPRKGYKFTLDISGNLISGRNQATLQIFTSNPEFPDIAYPINAQKGIIALPEEVYMGLVGKVPKSFRFQVSRPGTPVTITVVGRVGLKLENAAQSTPDRPNPIAHDFIESSPEPVRR